MSRRSKDLGPGIPSREITPEGVYRGRRALLGAGAAWAAGAVGSRSARAAAPPPATPAPALPPPAAPAGGGGFASIKKGPFATGETQTPLKDVTSYNNFYEFGTDKGDPAANAHTLKTRPWTVACEGEVGKPQTLDIDTLLKLFPLEERIYRLRCVEAWSMVIPWVGFPLGALLKRLAPTSKAKYVAFTTLLAPEQMPGQKRGFLDWPYVEGLRLDEAMHPLTILAVGLYGKPLPNQNGAPLRLVVPWKYGFKSIKSIVKIRLQDSEPRTSWNISAPDEYGFYANVNPEVDHPRWSQARERRLGEFLRRQTMAFNGYGGEVSSLYAGMNLRANY